MKSLDIRLSHKQYPIQIKNGLIDEVGKEIKAIYHGEKIAVITDHNIDCYYGKELLIGLKSVGFKVEKIVVPAGEKSKSFAVLLNVYDRLSKFGITREDLLITLGGGVVGDLGGFAAATFLRGVPYVQVPTSLLAQVDSSIGGKVAVDLPQGKNLVGSFYHPEAVLIDPNVLCTLNPIFFRDGLAEVIKYGCIRDEALFINLMNYRDETELLKNMDEIIETCCKIKKELVEKDERDLGERMALNFGHTIGHALERYFDYEQYTHGESVAAGMYMITSHSERLGLTEQGSSEKIKTILTKYRLPSEIKITDRSRFFEYMKLDKKKMGNQLNLVILKKIGESQTIKTNFELFRRSFKI